MTLNLIEAIFEANFDYMLDVDYTEIVVTFKKEAWTIYRKLHHDSNGGTPSLIIKSSKSNTEPFNVGLEQVLPSLPSYMEKVDISKTCVPKIQFEDGFQA